jgi:hypothetical protein
LQVRTVTHPVFPGLWLVEATVYGDRWTTLGEGDIWECLAEQVNYVNAVTMSGAAKTPAKEG